MIWKADCGSMGPCVRDFQTTPVPTQFHHSSALEWTDIKPEHGYRSAGHRLVAPVARIRLENATFGSVLSSGRLPKFPRFVMSSRRKFVSQRCQISTLALIPPVSFSVRHRKHLWLGSDRDVLERFSHPKVARPPVRRQGKHAIMMKNVHKKFQVHISSRFAAMTWFTVTAFGRKMRFCAKNAS